MSALISNESAGRIKSTATRPGNPYLKGALGIAAMSAARSKGTYLSAKYSRIAARRGPVKAIVAVEHAILIAMWNMLTTGEHYVDPGDDFYTRLNQDKTKNRAIDQLRKMGFNVTCNPRPLPRRSNLRIRGPFWASDGVCDGAPGL